MGLVGVLPDAVVLAVEVRLAQGGVADRVVGQSGEHGGIPASKVPVVGHEGDRLGMRAEQAADPGRTRLASAERPRAGLTGEEVHQRFQPAERLAEAHLVVQAHADEIGKLRDRLPVPELGL